MSSVDVRKKGVSEMRKILENYDKDEANKQSSFQMRNLFPFDKTVFSDYKEVGDTLRDTFHIGDSKTIESFLDKKGPDIVKDIFDESVKIYVSLQCEMKQEGTENKDIVHLNTANEIVNPADDRKVFYEKLKSDLVNRLEHYQGKGSGFRLNRIIGLRMFQTKIKPLSGSKYIELPDWLKNKKAVVNIQNKDVKCFMWCILAHLYPVDQNPERVSKYKDHISKINFEGFEFPFQVKDVDKFEKRNNLAVNIVTHDVSGPAIIESYKVSKNINVDLSRVINLLLVTDCSGEGVQETQKHRYVCYADFESVIYKIDSVNNSRNKSWSENVGKHKASAFCVIVVDSFTQSIYEMKSYVGYNTITKFNEYILDVCERLLSMPDMEMKNLTNEEWKEYDSCNSCPQCENVFDGDKVKDHDHWTGLYRGPLCNSCNLLKQKNKFIPVFFHNLKGYDSHHIISDEESSKLLKEK
ncbi:Protein CBG24840, partial [Caenorhabditis briggsae]